MGVKGNTWSNTTKCGMDVGLSCNQDGTVNTIDLESSNLTGSICSDIGKLTTLVIINLSFNTLRGPIPASIGQLSRLQKLNLGNNTLTGPLPATFSALNNLTYLSLSYNGFSGVILPSISGLSRLQYFQVRRNSFQGNIFSALAFLSRLTFVDISQNNFGGTIPPEFGNLINLQSVALSHNRLTGNLPATLSSLGRLTRIDFTNNTLKGPIPSSFANLTNLYTLSFRQNQFTGEIPSELGNLTKLMYLSFDINDLSGIVPPTLGNLVHLTTLEVLNSGAECPTGAGQSCVVKQSASSQFCYQCNEFCPSCIPIAEPAPPSPPPPPPSSGLSVGAIVGIALAGVLFAALLAGGVWLLCKRMSTAESSSGAKPSDGASRGGGASVPTQSLMCQRYPLAVVATATDNWAEANHIGSGGYGEVYRGVCPDDPLVVWAVKRAKILTNDFKREVEEMASKSHPHLVRLLGYCVDMDMTTEHYEQIVIYEFCSNGDLEKYLSGGRRGKRRRGKERGCDGRVRLGSQRAA
ncbi:unnamed protein product [Closterium sp. Naga37s-1]|nr:unnamed protein product [Closterium sp. Naga37s-1]